MNDRLLSRIVSNICSNSIFIPRNEVFCLSPYVRPIYNVQNVLFDGKAKFYASYIIQKLLRVIYEIDAVYFPINQRFEQFRKDFEDFYSDELKIIVGVNKKFLEDMAFGHMYSKIHGKVQNSKNLIDFLKSEYERFSKIESNSTCDIILSSKDPERAAKIFLANFSIDTLSEGSAMLRVLGGNYGILQNNMFKILYDELGQGIYDKRHNILYEKLLTSIGMHSTVHYYWNFYLPSNLQLNNYFQYLVSNKILFFRYIGCLFAAEASFSNTSMHITKTLEKVFGSSINREYFDEHYNVDKWHGKVALNLIMLACKAYGENIVSEVQLGYFGFLELVKCNNTYFKNYIKWLDNIEIISLKKLNDNLGTIIYTKHFKNFEFISEVAETKLLFCVNSEFIELRLGIDKHIKIKEGEAILIEHGILYQYSAIPNAVLSLYEYKSGN
jgi:hypothetical protein